MTSDESLYQSIETVLDYIEKNLKFGITLDDISNEVHISKFHLNRIFHSISKNRLMEYVRKRKLSSSTKELLETDFKIADISQEYGFEYEQSYIRAFEHLFGVTPRQFRLQKPSVEIKDRINIDYVLKVDRGIINLDPPIVLIPGFYVAGIRNKISITDDWNFNIGNQKGNDFFKNYRHFIKNTVNPSVYIGIVEYTGVKFGYTFYTPSIRISAPFHAAKNICCMKVPINKYVAFKYIGLHSVFETNVSMLPGITSRIVTEWFSKSGYVQAAPYHFEKIDWKISRDDYCEVQLYYPIERKSNKKKDNYEKMPVICQRAETLN